MAKHICWVTGEMSYTCEKCSNEFTNINKTFSRVYDEFPMECDLCREPFISKKELEEHRSGHNHQCNECNVTILDQELLKSHKCVKYTSDIKCEYCKKVFKDESSFKIHQFLHQSYNKLELCLEAAEKGDEIIHKKAEPTEFRKKEIKLHDNSENTCSDLRVINNFQTQENGENLAETPDEDSVKLEAAETSCKTPIINNVEMKETKNFNEIPNDSVEKKQNKNFHNTTQLMQEEFDKVLRKDINLSLETEHLDNSENQEIAPFLPNEMNYGESTLLNVKQSYNPELISSPVLLCDGESSLDSESSKYEEKFSSSFDTVHLEVHEKLHQAEKSIEETEKMLHLDEVDQDGFDSLDSEEENLDKTENIQEEQKLDELESLKKDENNFSGMKRKLEEFHEKSLTRDVEMVKEAKLKKTDKGRIEDAEKVDEVKLDEMLDNLTSDDESCDRTNQKGSDKNPEVKQGIVLKEVNILPSTSSENKNLCQSRPETFKHDEKAFHTEFRSFEYSSKKAAKRRCTFTSTVEKKKLKLNIVSFPLASINKCILLENDYAADLPKVCELIEDLRKKAENKQVADKRLIEEATVQLNISQDLFEKVQENLKMGEGMKENEQQDVKCENFDDLNTNGEDLACEMGKVDEENASDVEFEAEMNVQHNGEGSVQAEEVEIDRESETLQEAAETKNLHETPAQKLNNVMELKEPKYLQRNDQDCLIESLEEKNKDIQQERNKKGGHEKAENCVSYLCGTCEKEFTTMADITEDLRKHMEEKKIVNAGKGKEILQQKDTEKVETMETLQQKQTWNVEKMENAKENETLNEQETIKVWNLWCVKENKYLCQVEKEKVESQGQVKEGEILIQQEQEQMKIQENADKSVNNLQETLNENVEKSFQKIRQANATIQFKEKTDHVTNDTCDEVKIKDNVIKNPEEENIDILQKEVEDLEKATKENVDEAIIINSYKSEALDNMCQPVRKKQTQEGLENLNGECDKNSAENEQKIAGSPERKQPESNNEADNCQRNEKSDQIVSPEDLDFKSHKTFDCKYCSKEFEDEKTLQAHHNLLHVGSERLSYFWRTGEERIQLKECVVRIERLKVLENFIESYKRKLKESEKMQKNEAKGFRKNKCETESHGNINTPKTDGLEDLEVEVKQVEEPQTKENVNMTKHKEDDIVCIPDPVQRKVKTSDSGKDIENEMEHDIVNRNENFEKTEQSCKEIEEEKLKVYKNKTEGTKIECDLEYACEECSEKFFDVDKISEHLTISHPDSVRSNVKTSEFRKDIENKMEHDIVDQDEHVGKTEPICNEIEEEKLNEGETVCRKIEETKFKCNLECEECNEKFSDVDKISEHLTISHSISGTKFKKIDSEEATQVADEATKVVEEVTKVSELKEVECKEEPDVEVAESKELIKFEDESEVDAQGPNEIYIDIMDVTENIKLEELLEAKTKEGTEPEKNEIASSPVSTARTCAPAVEPEERARQINSRYRWILPKPKPAENIKNPKKTCLVQLKEPTNSSKIETINLTEAGFVKPDMMGKPIYLEKLNWKSVMNKTESFGGTEKVEAKVPKNLPKLYQVRAQDGTYLATANLDKLKGVFKRIPKRIFNSKQLLYTIEPPKETSPMPVIKTEDKEITNQEREVNKTEEIEIEKQEKAVNKTIEKEIKDQEKRVKKIDGREIKNQEKHVNKSGAKYIKIQEMPVIKLEGKDINKPVQRNMFNQPVVQQKTTSVKSDNLEKLVVIKKSGQKAVLKTTNLKKSYTVNIKELPNLSHVLTELDKQKKLCSVCFKVLHDVNDVAKHISWLNGKVSYTCNLCSAAFTGLHVNKHFVRVKLKQILVPFVCFVCKKVNLTKEAAEEHMSEHRSCGYRCSLCNFTVEEKELFVAHQCPLILTQFRCKVCLKSFADENNLKVHENLHQIDKTLRHRYKRGLPQEVFDKSKKNLKYCCSLCKFTTNDVDKFVKHLCTKPSSKQFKCKFCPKVFTNEENFLFHENLHEAVEKKPHLELSKNLEKPGEFVLSLRKGKTVEKHVEKEICFVCDRCKKTFSAASELTKHVTEHPQVPAILLPK